VHRYYPEDEVKVLAVISGASLRTLTSFDRLFGTSFTVLADPSRVVAGRRYRVRGNPSVVIIDKGGMVHYSGGLTTAPAMKRSIESIRNPAEG
jgi:hypothetical protein